VLNFGSHSLITTQKECKIDAFPHRVTHEVKKKRSLNFGKLGSSHWIKSEWETYSLALKVLLGHPKLKKFHAPFIFTS
jgi:hypothetical protein